MIRRIVWQHWSKWLKWQKLTGKKDESPAPALRNNFQLNIWSSWLSLDLRDLEDDLSLTLETTSRKHHEVPEDSVLREEAASSFEGGKKQTLRFGGLVSLHRLQANSLVKNNDLMEPRLNQEKWFKVRLRKSSWLVGLEVQDHCPQGLIRWWTSTIPQY